MLSYIRTFPDTPKLILGDYNGCPLTSILSHYQKCAKCAARDQNLLICGTVKKKTKKKHTKQSIRHQQAAPTTMLSFHCPHNKQKLKSEKPKIRSVCVWDDHSMAAPQGCFDCMDWSVFDCADLDDHVEIATSHIDVCVVMWSWWNVRKRLPTRNLGLQLRFGNCWIKSEHLKRMAGREGSLYKRKYRQKSTRAEDIPKVKWSINCRIKTLEQRGGEFNLRLSKITKYAGTCSRARQCSEWTFCLMGEWPAS